MIKIIIIVLTISFSGCNISSNNSKISEFEHLNKQSLSISSTYLTARYFISKGDAYTASNILNANTDEFKLLKLKFISNLMSGNFEYANKISNSFDYDKKKGSVYILPELAIALNKNNLETSLQAGKKIKDFLNLNILTELVEFWLFHQKNKSTLNYNNISQETSIYKLLILENFYDAEKLKKIADENYKLNNLTNNDLLLLAGYYFRLNDIEKFNIIIEDKLSNQFDKKYLIENFSITENIFYQRPNLKIILASKIYNDININNSQEYSSSDLKILLEMILYLCPNMDAAKYSLAELYNDQKYEKIALNKLDSISSKSFFYLPSNLKLLSILKSSKLDQKYKKYLLKNVDMWPNNIFIMLQFADYEKSQNNYHHAIKIYKNIISNNKGNNRILFLYASALDKTGRWNEAQKIFMKILEKNPEDTYSLNYIAYNLALRNEDLDLALNFIKKALSLDPNNGFFLDTLGWIEYKKSNFMSSVFYLEKSVIALPKSSEVIDHLGDCYLMLGRTNEAIYEWKKALKYENDTTIINLIKKKLSKYE
jgi:hypothetical protein